MPEHERLFLDTVSLSNFALAGRLDLLVVRYGQRGQVTTEVLDEISSGVAAGYVPLGQVEDAVAAGSLTLTPPLSSGERATYRELLRTLGSGEASCIVCARFRGGSVATDDRAARARCAELGVPVTGTVGILKACCREGSLHRDKASNVSAATSTAHRWPTVASSSWTPATSPSP